MPNINYNPQNSHTQEKLQVFSNYLDLYLAILLRQDWIKRVDIYDIFAGEGMYGEDAGSAKLAFDIIRKHREKSEKDVYLHLNDSNPDHYRKLCEIFEPDEWVSCQQKDANDAIDGHLKNIYYKGYKLFYLDPFGYSQIKKTTLDNITRSPKTECFLFVPVSRIAQFVRKELPTEEQIPAIRNFLEEYDIDVNNYPNAKWGDWGRIIKNSFARVYSNQFVGMAVLDANAQNYYGLYFIGGHVYGLDRFVALVAKREAEKSYQLELFPSDDKKIDNYLSEPKTNIELYIWGLRQGWTPTKTKEVLAGMEENRDIIITMHDAQKKHRKGAFYLGYDNYKKSPNLSVELVTK